MSQSLPTQRRSFKGKTIRLLPNGRMNTIEFKREVVLYYLSHEELTNTAIAKKFGISRPALREWVSIFAKQYPTMDDVNKAIVEQEADRISAISTTSDSDVECVRPSKDEEIERLKLELKRQQLRADAYEELINVAESKFNIAIRKKVGAKQ